MTKSRRLASTTNSAAIPRPATSRVVRWVYASLGVVCVGLGAVGVVVPGLPTTVFLLAASWLFARSCPWLEQRMLRIPLFRPFLRYLEPGVRMPPRALVATLVVMWTAIASSAVLLTAAGGGRLAAALLAAGLVGSVVIVWVARWRRRAGLTLVMATAERGACRVREPAVGHESRSGRGSERSRALS